MSGILIALIVVVCLSLGVNIFAFVLEKVYKKKALKLVKKENDL